MAERESFEQAVSEFDVEAVQAAVHDAEALRQETLERYPRKRWAELTLEEYAQGQDDHPDNFCRWIERQTEQMGSIRGGSARKLIVYKRRNEPGWYFPPGFENEHDAWEAVRTGFIEAIELADQGRWEEIEQIEPLNRGAALVTKVLWVYFPTELLPINSSANLRHFLRVAGLDDLADDQALGTIQLNRQLLAELRKLPPLQEADTKALERFLYMRFSPFEGRVVKIAPGQQGRYWDECRDGGYICVGWDEVGDLRKYESKDAFLTAFDETFAEKHPDERKRREKADELWLLVDLAVGDRIVANRGTQEVLAVGTVVAPGYVWDPDRNEYNHTVRVEWDDSYARKIPAQPYWAFKTVLQLQAKVAAVAVGEEVTDEDSPPPPGGEEEPLFPRIRDALERKGQAILYGPPGTGKTWHARRFASWWLKQRNAEAPATAAPAPAAEETGQAWLVTTKPSEWEWDELFDAGETKFRRGRLQRNYGIVSPGDLVFGYTATPTKAIEVLARIHRLEEAEEDGGTTFVLSPITWVKNGPTWDELLQDVFLAESEPLRNRMQGTLFSLQPEESERLLALIGEEDPDALDALDSDGGKSPTNGRAQKSTDAEPLANVVEWVTFHPSYSYEDFVEGFRPAPSGTGLELVDGIFKEMCQRAFDNPDRTFLLIIDEINRANVTKVLGELITLIEKDKRSRDDEFAVRLPYSREALAVPPNLFLLGTMNTADRSIKMLDTALRRRFGFVELMPDHDLLASNVAGVRLDDLLASLNRRIIHGAGREKQIGHSFFLKDEKPITDEAEFTDIFRDEVVPLLQEYAADDFDELASYLGDKIVDREQLTLDVETLSDPTRLLEALEAHLLGSADDE